MLETARGILEQYPHARFVTPVVNEGRAALVRRLAGDFPLEVSPGGMYDVLSTARFCMVASGTATLETALFGVPLVILYRVTSTTYWLARMVINIKNIGIVNILAGKRVVPEFIQHEATAANILPVALGLIADSPARAKMIHDLKEVRALLGGGGASECAAGEILTFLKGKTTG
jgi:lipid-A-disaccharide synthase